MGRPVTGRKPQRQIRCLDEEWLKFKVLADRKGLTVTSWLLDLARKELAIAEQYGLTTTEK